MDNKLLICSHSGGLDSSTVIAKAIAEGYIVQPVNFLYGREMKSKRLLNSMCG